MKNITNQFDTSQDLVITHYKNGVKFLRPEEIKQNQIPQGKPVLTLGDLLKRQDFNVFLTNQEGRHVALNEALAKLIGYSSPAEGIGKTIYDICKGPLGDQVRQNDIEVIRTQNYRIVDEYSTIYDSELILNFLTMKYPCYYDDNKIFGVFGFSVCLSHQSISNAIIHLSQMGFLPSEKSFHVPTASSKLTFHNVTISRRETDILRYTVRGYTAKHIADLLQLSARTVEQHLVNIKHKLGVYSKAQLIDKVIDKFT